LWVNEIATSLTLLAMTKTSFYHNTQLELIVSNVRECSQKDPMITGVSLFHIPKELGLFIMKRMFRSGLKKRISTAGLCIIFMLSCIVLLTEFSFASGGAVTWQGMVVKHSPLRDKLTIRVSDKLTLDFIPDSGFQSAGNHVSPHSVISGDRAVVSFIPGGKTIGRVEVNGHYSAGSLIFINRQKLILSCGQQIYLSENPRILLNSEKAEVQEIKTGTRVFVRVDPETGLAGTVEAIDMNLYKPAEQDKRFSYNKLSVDKVISSGSVEKVGAENSSFRFGEGIRVELQGTPGKSVSFDITGNASDIPLKEIRPGIYRGEYLFSRGDVRRSYLIFKMQDQQGSSYRIYPQSIDIACSPPEIIPVSPAADKTVNIRNSLVYAEFLTKGSLIDASSVQLYLNGKQVTTGLDTTVHSVRGGIETQVKPGLNTLEIRVRDEAGNSVSKKWTFSASY
jgi:hypothetical protein